MIKKNFLVEIGTEELPTKKLFNISENFKNNLILEINKLNISYKKLKLFFSARRIAINIKNIFFHNDIEKNFFKENILNIIYIALKKISIAKFMTWGKYNQYKFIRPVNNITVILGNQLIKGSLFGVQSSKKIFGHRFLKNSSNIVLDDASDYEKKLLYCGKIIVDFQKRKNRILKKIKEITYKINAVVYINKNILEEINALVEWPVVLIGSFKKKFLNLPKKVLIYIMEKDQKYFPLYDKNNNLIPKFIFISNIYTRNNINIIKGHETVIQSRFSDAKYFFNLDIKKKLKYYLPELKKLIFHKKIGNMFDKTLRIIKLSKLLSKKIIPKKTKIIVHAAKLLKCDLVTNMVCEFTQLQGYIGKYYASIQGEEKDVYNAILEHYKPLNNNDHVPNSLISCILAISDKIDTLVGILSFCEDNKSIVKGDRDPFGLKRIVISIIKIIIEKKISLNFNELIENAIFIYNENGFLLKNKNIFNIIKQFIFIRIINFYKNQGYKIDILKSLISCKIDNLLDFDKRLHEIHSFYELPNSNILLSMNKRILNILLKAKNFNIEKINLNILKQKEEIVLVNYIKTIKLKIHFLINNQMYMKALLEIMKINDSLNNFFKNVMINIDNKALKNNRLNILYEIKSLILKITDVSYINKKI